MDNAQKVAPGQIMAKIAELHKKLADGGAATEAATFTTTAKVVEDQVVFTDKLEFAGTELAVFTRVDPRPIAEVKAEAEASRTNVQAKADAIKSEYDKVITAVDTKVSK